MSPAAPVPGVIDPEAIKALLTWLPEVRAIKNPFGPEGFNRKWNAGAERLCERHNLSVAYPIPQDKLSWFRHVEEADRLLGTPTK